MRFFSLRFFPFLAFLGTAVGGIFNGQQLNISILTVALAFIFSLSAFGENQYKSLFFKPYFIFVVISFPGFIFYLFRQDPLYIPIVQYVGFFVVFGTACLFIRNARFSAPVVFDVYLKCAVISAYCAIVQQAGYLLGIEPLYDWRALLTGAAELTSTGPFLRAPSLFTEPSYFAVFLIPAAYSALVSLNGSQQILSKYQSILIIIAITFSFSAIGYIGVILCVVAAFRVKVFNIIFAALVIVLIYFVSINNIEISSRMGSIFDIFDLNINGRENYSALLNKVNLLITGMMFVDRPIFGAGLGGYRVYSSEYLNVIVAENPALRFMLNESLSSITLGDGGSMYLRYASELGAFGILFLGVILIKNWNSNVSSLDRHISTAAILFVVVFSVRSGQIIRFDIAFFLALLCLIRFQRFAPTSLRV
jgi:multisubunit Na+/H+ antiporter MnhF subunit